MGLDAEGLDGDDSVIAFSLVVLPFDSFLQEGAEATTQRESAESRRIRFMP